MAAFVEQPWSSPMSGKKGGWEEVEDSQLMLELMLSSLDRSPGSGSPRGELRTLDLLGAADSAGHLDVAMSCTTSTLLAADALDLDAPLPPGWQKCLDLQTGRVYYLQSVGGIASKAMAPSDADAHHDHSHSMKTTMNESMATKRLRGLHNDEAGPDSANVISIFGVDLNSAPLPKLMALDSAAAAKQASDGGDGRALLDMTTVGCANCLMFVMLSASNPRCPNCGSSVVLDFLQPSLKRPKQI